MKNKLRDLARWSPMAQLSRDGFTLVEMLVVILLIGVVATFAASRVMTQYDQSRVRASKIQIRQLGVMLDQYRLDCGTYPTSAQGLDALAENPGDCSNFLPGGYIKDGKVPKDGFGNDFIYESDGNEYEIVSLGKDRKNGGSDFARDISSKNLDEKKDEQ